MVTLLIFIAVLAVLVLSHEFGHFIVARKNGIKVDEFGFGFPPRIGGVRRVSRNGVKKWEFVWGNKETRALSDAEEHLPSSETLYSVNWIPLGGFVKIKGEDGSGTNDPDSFANKKAWQKASVLIAGVFMNVLVGAILLSIGFMVGLPQEVSEKDTNVYDRKLEIAEVLPGKPAEAAGIQTGDIVVKIDELTNPHLSEFQNYVNAHRDSDVSVVIQRGAETLAKKIHPTIYADTGKAGIGVAIAEIGTVRFPWYKAIYYGIINTGLYLKEIIFGFGLLIKGLVTGAGVGGAVSGPVGVAVMTGRVARLGFVYLLQFTAVLSLNLAVLNVFPIPALDGGRLLFVIISKIIRRPVTPKIEQVVHTIGFTLLMLLVVVVTVKDLGNFSGMFVNLWHKVF